MDNISQQPQTQSVRESHKKVSLGRVFILVLLGFLIGMIYSLLFATGSWYLPPLVLAIVLGFLGYFWKARVYEPLSMEDLKPVEWAIWIPISVLITPVLSGTVAYYIYAHKNKYPIKWKRINIILVIGFIVDILIFSLLRK